MLAGSNDIEYRHEGTQLVLGDGLSVAVGRRIDNHLPVEPVQSVVKDMQGYYQHTIGCGGVLDGAVREELVWILRVRHDAACQSGNVVKDSL